jgi:hypothetical protein
MSTKTLNETQKRKNADSQAQWRARKAARLAELEENGTCSDTPASGMSIQRCWLQPRFRHSALPNWSAK